MERARSLGRDAHIMRWSCVMTRKDAHTGPPECLHTVSRGICIRLHACPPWMVHTGSIVIRVLHAATAHVLCTAP